MVLIWIVLIKVAHGKIYILVNFDFIVENIHCLVCGEEVRTTEHTSYVYCESCKIKKRDYSLSLVTITPARLTN